MQNRIASLVWWSQPGLTPTYLLDLCRAVLGAHISHSTFILWYRGCSLVPFASTTTMQSRALSVRGPVVRNNLPLVSASQDTLRHFNQHLKTLLLTVLESGAPLSSSFEEVLYKSSND